MNKPSVKNTVELTKIKGISALTFADKSFIRMAINHQPVRYRLSWLYILRCSRDDRGNLGYKFIQNDMIAIIGVRNDCIYITPLTEANNVLILRNLCHSLSAITQRTIIVRKAEFTYQKELPFRSAHTQNVLLEDDTQPETMLDFHKLFTPDKQPIRQAVRWRRKIATFESQSRKYAILTSLADVSQAQLKTFFSLPLTAYKHTSYAAMMQYMRTMQDNHCGCMIFLKGKAIKGLYLYERFGLERAGLYCGVTARDEQGATEWMDLIVFQDMYSQGINQLLLGGAEKEGVNRYIDKLLAQKPPYISNSFVYSQSGDIDDDTTVRLARPSDFKVLSKLYAEFYNDLDKLGEHWTLESARKFISHFYNRQSDLFFVAQNHGQVIGFIVAAVQPWWDGNHLVEGELIVSAAFQQRSVCTTKLLQALLHTAESQYQAVSWDTFMPITHGHPFHNYSQLGFQPIPSRQAMSGDVRTILNQLQIPRLEVQSKFSFK